MNKYEELLEIAHKENISVFENYDLSETRFKGLYYDRNIALSKELQTSSEKKCILYEELGHHYTTAGNILDQSKVENRKQERHARLWAYQHALQLSDLISAYKKGYRNRYEIAEYLNVTEQFLQDALNIYKEKYGVCMYIDNYILYFEPLGVLKVYDDK